MNNILTFIFLTVSVSSFGQTPDSSNQNIYDFMKIVIADQKLDLSYGLTIEPESNCNLLQDDKTFLKTLLIQNKKQAVKSDTSNWRNKTFTSYAFELNKCLTKADIATMLLQKEKLASFKWDNSRLGFKLSNHKNWYCFSIPIFSQDKNKAVMMIRNLCSGLCGTGWTVLFIKENGKWISQTGEQWMH
jgi:hypothetical protein